MKTGSSQAAAFALLTGSVRLGHVMGDGYIAFTVDDVGTNGRYQGIVELDDQYPVMQRCTGTKILNSNTVVVCAAEAADGWQAVALMLQRIAAEGGKGGGMT